MENTRFKQVYDRFIDITTDDMYVWYTPEQTREDCLSIAHSAFDSFQFPKPPLLPDYEQEVFGRVLTNEEITILANEMMFVWLTRQIFSGDNIRQKVSASDFKMSSQAAHLTSLRGLAEDIRLNCRRLQRIYNSRRINLAGEWQSNLNSWVGKEIT